MQHEVLLALSGCPGNTFAVSRQSGLFEPNWSDSSIGVLAGSPAGISAAGRSCEVIPDLPFVHPSEVSLLNRLSCLGTYYMQLRDFISQQTAACTSLVPPQPVAHDGGSLYLKAMAYGIDKVLDAYRQKLVIVEQKCMTEPHLPVSHMQHEFEVYQFLLPSLDACVKYIHRHKLHGCQILSYLHQQCSSGVTTVKNAFERILCVCHGVLYKQLSAWMLHGLLLDQKGEFFIERVQPSAPAEAEREEESDEGESSSLSDSTTERDLNQFRINHRLAPSYLPPRVLEKILFIGEAVQIFQTQNISSAQPPLPSFSTGSGFQLRADQVKFSRMLSQLQAQPVFQLRDLESTVEFIRNVVAQHLWRLLVEESSLVGHLQTMKEFFLLGRGELFLEFVDMADTLMKQSSTPTTQHDVNVAFRQAMIKIGMDHEELAKQFELIVTTPTSELGKAPARSKRKTSAWRYIGLAHTVSWPLHVVFTPAALEKYSSLFHFLLSLRRAQIALQQGWAVLMTLRAHTHSLQPVWQLRTLMGFLIDNLQYYVQVDVLEAQYSLLVEKIKSTHDFETIKHAHSEFLSTLQSQLFFSLDPVRRSIAEILDLCFSFGELVHGLDREDFIFTTENYDRLGKISKEFRRQSSLLFRVLSSVKSHHSAPHLAQLLLRVDYNKYFTNTDH